jgi:hypothetical protein
MILKWIKEHQINKKEKKMKMFNKLGIIKISLTVILLISSWV